MVSIVSMLIFPTSFLLPIKLHLHFSPPLVLQNFRKFYITTETCLFTCLTDVGKPNYSLISHYCTSLLVLDFLQSDHKYRGSTFFLTLRIQFFYLIHLYIIMIAIVVIVNASIISHYNFFFIGWNN